MTLLDELDVLKTEVVTVEKPDVDATSDVVEVAAVDGDAASEEDSESRGVGDDDIEKLSIAL